MYHNTVKRLLLLLYAILRLKAYIILYTVYVTPWLKIAHYKGVNMFSALYFLAQCLRCIDITMSECLNIVINILYFTNLKSVILFSELRLVYRNTE